MAAYFEPTVTWLIVALVVGWIGGTILPLLTPQKHTPDRAK